MAPRRGFPAPPTTPDDSPNMPARARAAAHATLSLTGLALSSLALSSLTLCACSATDGAAPAGRRTDLGRVPLELVELYDMAATDGVIEIELDRDGRIVEMEAEIPLLDVPKVAADAALAHLPAGRVTGAERELTRRGPGYELKFDVGGLAWEVVVDEQGNILETEQELDPLSAPRAVIDTANATVPGGVLRSVELIVRRDSREYHVKKDLLGVTYKIVTDGDGRLLRAVREARAEIEIPLAPNAFARKTR